MEATLQPTDLIDSDHPAVVEFAHEHARGETERERAVSLYHAVRDGFRYDPYRLDLRPEGMRASTVLANGYGWCVPKSALLAAVCRASGIPARVGYADVKNHMATERLLEAMGTDVFIWHGYTDILLDGRWTKATPAFNKELCDRLGLEPLEYDGVHDSLYQEFNHEGHQFMEYVNQRGAFEEVPLAQMVADFQEAYPVLMAGVDLGDRDADIDAEHA